MMPPVPRAGLVRRALPVISAVTAGSALVYSTIAIGPAKYLASEQPLCPRPYTVPMAALSSLDTRRTGYGPEAQFRHSGGGI